MDMEKVEGNGSCEINRSNILNTTYWVDNDPYEGTLPTSFHLVIGIYLAIVGNKIHTQYKSYYWILFEKIITGDVFKFQLMTVGVAAFVGNGTVFLVFWKNKHFRQPINAFILNLAAADLIEASLGYPFSSVSNIKSRWSFGKAGCDWYGCICFLTNISNLCTFCAVSIYRYSVVCKTNAAHRMKKPQTVVLILAVVWTYSIIWALLPFLGWGSYGPEPFHTSCSIDWIGKSVSAQTYVWFIFISIVVVPVLVMTYSYYHVLVTVRTQVTPIAPEAVSSGPPSRVAHPAHGITFERGIDRRANKIVFVTMLLYCIAWLPYTVLSMLSTVGVHVPDMMTMIPCILAKSQCAFNPIVYLITHRPFRHSFYHICRCNPSMYINENASQIDRNQLELIIDETRM